MNAQHYILHAEHPDRQLVRANLDSYLNRLPDDKSWEIEVRQYHKTRTDKQRRSLFGVAYKAIMDATGLRGARDKDQLHENMCGEFFGWKAVPMLGRVPVRTTTVNENGEKDEIDTNTALDMYEHIQRIAIEYGIDVPDPDPLYRELAQSSRVGYMSAPLADREAP